MASLTKDYDGLTKETHNGNRNETINDNVLSPWPYLDAMFKCITLTDYRLARFYIFSACQTGRKYQYIVHASPSNLKKHIEISWYRPYRNFCK